MPHSVQVWRRDETAGRGRRLRVLREWGNGARPVSWISSWGNSRISVRYFCYFLFLVFFFLYFCFVFVLRVFFPLLSDSTALLSLFCFSDSIEGWQPQNFIMKLNRCQFIRLATRQYLELCLCPALPQLALPYKGSAAGLENLPTPVVHFLRLVRSALLLFTCPFSLPISRFPATMPARLICRYKSLTHLEPLCGTFVASNAKTLGEMPTLCASVATRLQASSS